MRLVQLSRHSIAFPSPEGALREPNGLLALGGDLQPCPPADGLSARYFPMVFTWRPHPLVVARSARHSLAREISPQPQHETLS